MPAPPPALTLRRDTPCRACGYQLKGLSSTAACPECGAPAADSIDVLARILIAPTAFKESLSALEAAEAMADGAHRAAESLGIDIGIDLTLDLCPVSDGGDGFLESLQAALDSPSRRRTALVRDPRAAERRAEFLAIESPAQRKSIAGRIAAPFLDVAAARLLLPMTYLFRFTPPLRPRRTAIIESAAAIGLRRVPPDQRNPERASSAGLADLITAALDDRCARLTIGLGGSATCDGGVGMAAALGAQFLDTNNELINSPTASDLPRIARIDLRSLDRRLRRATIIAACDVDNPLLGPTGAARTYAPQKGATPEQVDRLEAGLANLARAARASGITCNPDAPHSGAAGGLGFALAAFLNAELRSGAALVLESLSFDDRLRRSDLALTGEGRLDPQSLRGKATVALARAAAAHNVPVIALVGSIHDDADARPTDSTRADSTRADTLLAALARSGAPLSAVHIIAQPTFSREDNLRLAPELLASKTEQVIRHWLVHEARPR